MKRILAAVAVLGLLAGAANAGVIVTGPGVYNGTVDLNDFTSTGLPVVGPTADWITIQSIGQTGGYDNPAVIIRKDGANLLTYACAGDLGYKQYDVNNPTLTWTGGDPVASGSTNYYMFSGAWTPINITAPDPGAGITGTLYVWFDEGAAGHPLTYSGGAGSGTAPAFLATWESELFEFDYTGGSLTVSNPGYYSSQTGFQGAALIIPEAGGEVPEPATLLLVGTGALGVFGVIRRRRMA